MIKNFFTNPIMDNGTYKVSKLFGTLRKIVIKSKPLSNVLIIVKTNDGETVLETTIDKELLVFHPKNVVIEGENAVIDPFYIAGGLEWKVEGLGPNDVINGIKFVYEE